MAKPLFPGESTVSAHDLRSTAHRSDHLRLWIVTALIVGLVGLPAALWATEATKTFSGQVSTYGTHCTYCPAQVPNHLFLPAGTNIDLHWADTSVGYVGFAVHLPGASGSVLSQCSWGNATTGACSFASIGGNYTFDVWDAQGTVQGPQLVDYGGSYQVSIF
jgi:hypothetical protein